MKLPTLWRVEKQSREVESEDEKQRREVESEERSYNGAKVRRKKIHMREMLGEVAKCCVFPLICGSAGSKSRLLKAAAAEPCVQGRYEKLHTAVAPSTFVSQNVLYKAYHSTATKWHAAVVPSAFTTQNLKKTDGRGPFLELGMSKSGTPLWRQAHLQFKILKN